MSDHNHISRAYAILGRCDGVGGVSGSVDLPEELSARICKERNWARFKGTPLRLHRSGALELQGEGNWLEGWTRHSLYEVLQLTPWTTGDTAPDGVTVLPPPPPPATKRIAIYFDVPATLDTPSEVLNRMRDMLLEGLDVVYEQWPARTPEDEVLFRALLLKTMV